MTETIDRLKSEKETIEENSLEEIYVINKEYLIKDRREDDLSMLIPILSKTNINIKEHISQMKMNPSMKNSVALTQYLSGVLFFVILKRDFLEENTFNEVKVVRMVYDA